MSFEKLKLKATLLLTLNKINFKLPTDVQNVTIPFLMDNQNVFIKSSTGTGKTAAFLLPILNKINTKTYKIQSLIMAPTRELAHQIFDQVKILGQEFKDLSTALLIGGVSYDPQIEKLKTAHIVIGTPGRITDLLQQEKFHLNDVNMVVLDEADEIVRFGFKKDIEFVFKSIPKYCQIGLFSATENQQVKNIMEEYIKDFKIVDLNNQIQVNSQIENFYIFTKMLDRNQVIIDTLKRFDSKKAIIFTNTKINSFIIHKYLVDQNVEAILINGDKTQSQRTTAIERFKNNQAKVLVATDVVGRGIDVANIDLVINYELSMDNEDFIHRIGRTGRNNTKGRSVTFVNNASNLYKLSKICQQYEIKVKEIKV